MRVGLINCSDADEGDPVPRHSQRKRANSSIAVNSRGHSGQPNVLLLAMLAWTLSDQKPVVNGAYHRRRL
jgi:hypothetical protein